MTWLTVMEYLCHKRPRICSTCRKHFRSFSHSLLITGIVCNEINTTGVTSGAGTAYLSGSTWVDPRFSGVRVTRSLVLCVCFVDRCLSFRTFRKYSLKSIKWNIIIWWLIILIVFVILTWYNNHYLVHDINIRME